MNARSGNIPETASTLKEIGFPAKQHPDLPNARNSFHMNVPKKDVLSVIVIMTELKTSFIDMLFERL
jgi:hypothetical protein